MSYFWEDGVDRQNVEEPLIELKRGVEVRNRWSTVLRSDTRLLKFGFLSNSGCHDPVRSLRRTKTECAASR